MAAGRGGEDPYAGWVKISTKNASGADRNCFYCGVSEISRMIVDGVEVSPTRLYDFGDSNYHDVFLLPTTPTALGDNTLCLSNFTIRAADIPANYTTFGDSALRALGASQRVDTAIRATTMPTFGNYNWISWTVGHLYVPSDLMSAYITLTGINSSRVHSLEEYPYNF